MSHYRKAPAGRGQKTSYAGARIALPDGTEIELSQSAAIVLGLAAVIVWFAMRP